MKTKKYTDYLHGSKDNNWDTLREIFGLPESEDEKLCINDDCEMELDENDVFCKYCGTRYDKTKKKIIPMSEEAQRQFTYALYEIKVDCELDMDTGNIMILKINGIELKEPVKG